MSEIIYKYKRDMLKGQKLCVDRMRHGQSFEKHWHSYYEIIYYRNYRGHWILNGETYPVTGNCLFLLTPKDFHEILVESTPDSESYVISFSEQILDDAVFGEVTRGPIYIPQLPEWVCQQIERLYKTFTGQSSHRADYLYHLFNCILIELLEHGSSLSQTAPDINPIIRQSISIMLSNPAEPHSLADFSRRFNVSTTYFSRLFHENAGISFKQYLTVLRIEYAKRLLEEKKLPIIDVGCECGFNTPSQFIRAFKQLTGMTPSAYRAAVLQEH